MRILTAGGGSGGHVTPVVAVVHELQKRHPEAEIRFWCDKAFEKQARALMGQQVAGVRVDRIASGKLRRYHGIAWWKQALRLRTIVWPNLRDLFKIIFGTVQSFVKLIVWRPDVVFTKGGFVCLPIGFAAHVLGIKLVIHDSDAHPGLTNRILARWASIIATGAPTSYYPYPQSKMHYVGIPIKTEPSAESFDSQSLKSQLGFDANWPLVVVTGGGLGAKRLNDVVADSIQELLSITSVALISGQAQYEQLRTKLGDNTERFQLHAFVSKNFSDYLAATDIVVSRAGMTTLLELAALQKPSIIIPNIYLTGGHQQKNAQVYADRQAIIVLNESELDSQPEALLAAVSSLLNDGALKQRLSSAIGSFAKPEAAKDVANLIIELAGQNKH